MMGQRVVVVTLLVGLSLQAAFAGRVFVVNTALDDYSPTQCLDWASKCTLRSAYSQSTGGDTIQLGVDPVMWMGALAQSPGWILPAANRTSGVLTILPKPGRKSASISLRPTRYPQDGNFMAVEGWPWGGVDGEGLVLGLRLEGIKFLNFHYEGTQPSVVSIAAGLSVTGGRESQYPLLDVEDCEFRNNSVRATGFVNGGVLGVRCKPHSDFICPYNTTSCGVRVNGSAFVNNTIFSPGRSVIGSGGVALFLSGQTSGLVSHSEFINLTMSVANYAEGNYAKGVAIYILGCRAERRDWVTTTVVNSTFISCNGGSQGAVIYTYNSSLTMAYSEIHNSYGMPMLGRFPFELPSVVRSDGVHMNNTVIANADSRLAVVNSYWKPYYDTTYFYNLDGSPAALLSWQIENKNPLGTNLGTSTAYGNQSCTFVPCPSGCKSGDMCANVYSPAQMLVGFFCY